MEREVWETELKNRRSVTVSLFLFRSKIGERVARE